MDYIKIQSDALKCLSYKNNDVRYFEEERNILFFPDQYRGYRIPKSLFFLDTGKIKEFRGGEPIFNNTFPGHIAYDTEILKPSKNLLGNPKNKKLHVFKLDNGDEMLFSENLMKTIKPGKGEQFEYRTDGKNKIMKVYSGEICVAVIMPVMHK